jgi:branched-chain amino acid transport system permease protein
MNYILHILIYIDIYLILALSLNMLVGYSGLLTLAHSSFFALGAYSYALLNLIFGLSFFPCIILGILISLIFSLLISLSSWRLKGDFFVLASIAFQVIVFTLLNNWSDNSAKLGTLKNLTNGSHGIMNIPPPSVFGFTFNNQISMFLIATAIAIFCGFIIWKLKMSPWGRLLHIIREDELAARSIGKNTSMIKMQVIAFSCAFASVAGAIYAGYVGYIDPSSSSLNSSILLLSMVIVGGTGNLKGPIIGATFLILIPEILRYVDFPDTVAGNLRLLIYGLMLIMFMHFRPQGIAGSNGKSNE